ncbi:macrophage mannose receptor 1-like [Oratosquilla oratoria]|uniref:macrophage mannose receptor 1-like n=1 Tax=Oratosquilla oratoria TaxID=337810 RepID=UPI003F768717
MMRILGVFPLTLMLMSWAEGSCQECQGVVTTLLQQVLLKDSMGELIQRLERMEKKLSEFGEELRVAKGEKCSGGTNDGLITNEAGRCPVPFTYVYGKCVWADTATQGIWTDVRQRCQSIGADLVTIESADFLWHLIQHLHSTGANKASYWIGASKDAKGVWKWVNDSPVKLGTPFWGYWNNFKSKEPQDSETYACLYMPGLYFLHGCTISELKPPLCQMPINGDADVNRH